ncbi:glutathione peroxidase [Azospirillum oryzae]|uniref:Glutathione peroxidase n=1 Tax=Azospirillum oryzae TaxID=286727 RepID=A0A1X7ELI7_9PROT|nr:glutathione peroxidase [Azospirillum oryzae]SMF35899.1 glutathione peroxidase [Azospirillum oryzae]
MTTPLQDIPLTRITGESATLADHKDSVLLIVNVASKCGLTPQYAALEALHERYRDRGFAVLGFPANDFGAQEPGTNAEIEQFCRTNFSVDFPMFAKVAVTGEEQHPLYRALIAAHPTAISKPESGFRQKLEGYGIKTNPEPGILWNFEKFLIARDGTVAGRFAPDVTPDDTLVITAIETELAKA